MADLSKTAIVNNATILASFWTNLYDALTGDTVYDNVKMMQVVSGVFKLLGTYDVDFVFGSDSLDESGAHYSRMLFDKSKGAFRAGYCSADEWDDANRGNYSHAEGLDCMASGESGHAEGNASIASGVNSHSEGVGCTASGNQSHASGQYTVASGDGSRSEGTRSKARLTSQVAHASGNFDSTGDCQNTKCQLQGSTTDATKTELTSSVRFSLEDEHSYACNVTIHGRQDTGANHAMYKRMLIIERTGGTVALEGTVQTIGTDIESDANWDIDLTADDTNKSLKVEVTGVAGQNIRWTALIETVELGYSD